MQQPRLGAMDALDPEPLLRFLHERGVEHILIGGVASPPTALGGRRRISTSFRRRMPRTSPGWPAL
jgi:hypothetical protein